MAEFSAIKAAAQGYNFVWQKRDYIARAAIPVVLVKIVSVMVLYALGFDVVMDVTAGADGRPTGVQFDSVQLLRQNLILLPAVAVQGLFFVGLVRFALYREPILTLGRVKADMGEDVAGFPRIVGTHNRIRGIRAAVALYLLVYVVQSGIVGGVLGFVDSAPVPQGVDGEAAATAASTAAQDISGATIIAMLAMVLAIIWLFRILWIFIPAAMDYPLKRYLKRIRGMQSSVSMVLTWLICFIPMSIMFAGVMQMVAGALPQGVASFAVQTVLHAIFEVIVQSIVVVAMTYGVVQMITLRVEVKKK